jgi:hypothetical protein
VEFDEYGYDLKQLQDAYGVLNLKCLELKQELKELRSGHKGACPTCEPVGELNKKIEQDIKDFVELGTDQHVTEKIVRLESENKKMRDALEFYADEENWETNKDFISHVVISDADIEPLITNRCGFAMATDFGGKRAREALEQLKEGE